MADCNESQIHHNEEHYGHFEGFVEQVHVMQDEKPVNNQTETCGVREKVVHCEQ